jgi:hypothetical protein
MATVAELTAKLGLDNSDFQKGMSDSVSEVKNLQEGLKDALNELKQFAAGIKAKVVALQASATATIAQTRALSASQIAMKAATLATQAFKVALASTGIGLIVIALASLISYLTTTEAGMRKINQVVQPVVQIFERLKGVLQTLGESVFAGIAQMLNGELKEGFKTLANGAKNAGKQTVDAFKDGIKFGGELATLQNTIKDNELELEAFRAKAQADIAKLTALSRDSSKSEKEKADAAKQAMALIDQISEKEKALVRLRVRALEIQQSANDTDHAGKMEMIKLQNEIFEIEQRNSSSKIRLQNTENKGQAELLGLLKETNKERVREIAIMTGQRDPFSLEPTVKHSKETLDNIKKISDTLINPALKGAMSAGIIIPQESLDRIAQARDEQSRFNQEIAITQSLAGMLGNTFQSAFEGMLNSGKVSFKGIIDGLKALIIRLIAAAAAAFALAAILGGIGIGGFSMGGGGFMKGFKELFSSMSGIPKFAKGGMVMGPTLAMLGDNASGKEAVIPFEKMGSFLSQYGTGGGGNMKVEVVGRISGEDIFFSGVNYSNNRNKIIGG